MRHARLSRCMPSFLVVGTQKGGTSSLHYMLKSGWHTGIAVNDGEKKFITSHSMTIMPKGQLPISSDGTAQTLCWASAALMAS